MGKRSIKKHIYPYVLEAIIVLLLSSLEASPNNKYLLPPILGSFMKLIFTFGHPPSDTRTYPATCTTKCFNS